MKGKKGSVIIWMWVLIGIFLIGAVYMVAAKPWETLYNKLTPDLSGAALTTAQAVNTLFFKYPIIMIVALILVGLFASLRSRQFDQPFG